MKGNSYERKEPAQFYYSQIGNWNKKVEEDEYSNEVSFNGEKLYEVKEH